ncbi:uncharacterized protein LOC133182799 [Saccostrea echinata]|uniref:uncharacterized protein LOC133182799 n=1 Tax=Saccostrea echinata TaxID=191078 RepID=UPI002A80B528|nr:uncharacterized protein LOC133182799 [Saccostrea echinata]
MPRTKRATKGRPPQRFEPSQTTAMENRGRARRRMDRTQVTPSPNIQPHPEAMPGPCHHPMQVQQTQHDTQPLPAAMTQQQVSQQTLMQHFNQQVQPAPIPAQPLQNVLQQTQPQQTFMTQQQGMPGPSHQPMQPQQTQQQIQLLQTPTTQQVSQVQEQPQAQISQNQEAVPVHSVHNLGMHMH